MQTVTTMSENEFSRLINNIKRAGQLTNAMIQRAAVFSIMKSIDDRNSTPADTLFKAMPDGTRKNALVAYFEQNGNLAYVKSEKKIAFFDVADMTGKPAPVFNEALLAANPWHKSIKEADITSAWDAKGEIEKVLARLERAVRNNEREVTHADLIFKVKALLAEGAVSQ